MYHQYRIVLTTVREIRYWHKLNKIFYVSSIVTICDNLVIMQPQKIVLLQLSLAFLVFLI